MSRRMGWLPDVPDLRDHRFLSSVEDLSKPMPSEVDLRSFCPPVYDQGDLGSCTAQALAAAIEVDHLQQGLSSWTPSRLFIYYQERAMEGSIGSDSGAMIRDGIKSVNKVGAPHEILCPYLIETFSDRPPVKAYADAKLHPAISYARVPQAKGVIEWCLAARHPIVFGISVYESFEQVSDGNIPMPSPSEALLGGHAILMTGYDKKTDRVYFRNSWSDSWGDGGYGTLPFAYVLDQNLADDLWCIKVVR